MIIDKDHEREFRRLQARHSLIQNTILCGILNILAKDFMADERIATIVNKNNTSVETLLAQTIEFLKQ